MKTTIKKIGLLLLNIIEIYIPVITFVIMFSVFILQIFFRYVLNNPLTWPYEVTVFAFIWTVLLGACLARRKHEHVAFTIVYDKCSDKMQAIIRLLGNIIIFITFCIAIYPVYDYVQFMGIQKSTVLRIPFNILFSPFLVFVLVIIGHTAFDIVIDFKKLLKRKNGGKQV